MNIEWNTESVSLEGDALTRLLALAALAEKASGSAFAVISAIDGKGYFRVSLSLGYGYSFDVGLFSRFKEIASLIEEAMSEDERDQIVSGERDLGNSGVISKVRKDFFSSLTPPRLLEFLVRLINDAEGDIVSV